MKTNNRKILQLINHGFSGNLLSDLNEGQINVLYKRLVESKSKKCGCGCDKETCTCGPDCKKCDCGRQKKETKEETQVVTTQLDKNNQQDIAKLNGMLKNPNSLQGKNVQIKEIEVDKDDENKGEVSQSPVQVQGPDGMDDDSDKELQEKFESKKQQKYFFAKCGDGKTKEQKKWCKMAEEFAEKTNFKKLPEKKKETKETFDMGDYYKKVLSTAAGLNKKNLNQISPSVSMGESELEKRIVRLVEKHITPKMSKKDFLSLVSEQGTKEKERTKEKEKEKTKEKPGTPYKPKEGPAKAPKAHKHEVDEQDVAPSKPRIKEPVTKPNKPGTPYSPKPGPAKAPKASKGELPSWLSFKSIGIKLK